MSKGKYLLVILFLILLAGVFSCKHKPVTTSGTDPTPTPPPPPPPDTIKCDPDTVYFNKDILPLLNSSCAMPGCHDQVTHAEGVILTNYNSIITTGEIIPYDPGNSKVYEKVIDSDPNDRMPPPPASPLSSAQIEKIRKWISQGAKNNQCNEGSCDSVNVTYSSTLKPMIQTYCGNCHTAQNPGGGFDLSTQTGLANAANSGRLMGAVKQESGYSPMPKGQNKLSSCSITQIQKWISDGTPNN